MKYSYLLHFWKLSKIFTRRERFPIKRGFSSFSSERNKIGRTEKERKEGGNEIYKKELFLKWNVMFKYVVRRLRDVFLCKNLFSISIYEKFEDESDRNIEKFKVPWTLKLLLKSLIKLLADSSTNSIAFYAKLFKFSLYVIMHKSASKPLKRSRDEIKYSICKLLLAFHTIKAFLVLFTSF